MADFSTTSSATTAQQVVSVFNTAWDMAMDRVSDVQTAATYATATTLNPAQMTVDGLSYVPTLPAVPTVGTFDPNSVDARYQAYKNEIQNFLANTFTTYLATYFPPGQYIQFAQAWIERALSTGGTGLSPTIEAQMWERDRARILADAARATDEAMATWANKGYPLPPGAAAGQTLKIQSDALGQISEASRNVAIESAKIEIENIRFAVTSAIEMRKLAISTAIEYVRAMALGPTVAAQVASGIADVQARFAQIVASLFATQTEAIRVTLAAKTTDAELRLRAKAENIKSANEAQHDRVAAAISATSALGSIASAAVNSLHANASLSGNEAI